MTEPRRLLLSVQHIGFRIRNEPVLSDVSLTVRSGEIVTLIGPNGSGKTTLVRTALGLQKADCGTVERPPGLRIGYVPQRVSIDDTLPLSVERFLHIGHAGKHATHVLDNTVNETNIAYLLQRPVQSISGGEMQRVLLARALLQEPELLVLDEPAQGVDITGQTELYELISRIRAAHDCGVLMVSHDLHLVMAATDHVVCLNHHVCCSGHPEHVTRDPAYLELFGAATSPSLAVYTHHHDHRHDAHGDILSNAPATHDDARNGTCPPTGEDHTHG